MQYEPVIGLEIHANSLTATKTFLRLQHRIGEAPNTNVCPVVSRFPRGAAGTEPVRRGSCHQSRAGARLHGPRTSIFARKNYFYPDLPKGYQISPYEQPLATEGALEYQAAGARDVSDISASTSKRMRASRCTKGSQTRTARPRLDYNRSGVPP